MFIVMVNDIFLDNLPKIDLHGYDRDSARVMVNDFAVKEALDKNKKVLSHHVDGMNNGCTVVKIRV